MENIRTYRSLYFGGETIYMPTFNQDRTSLIPDINGSYEGTDGDYTTDDDQFADYNEYEVGDTKSDYVITESGTGTSVITHTAKETKLASIMTMSSWYSAGCPQGDIWVFDTDGWAYYAYPISPDTASGLLLDGITIRSNPTEEWYYAIEVTAQIASAGDWGTPPVESDDPDADPDFGTGMYEDGLSDEGLYLLNKVSGLVRATDLDLRKSNGEYLTVYDLQVAYGEVLALLATVTIENGTGLASEEKLNWSVELVPGGEGTDVSAAQINGTISDTGVFLPIEGMEGNWYAITVSSDLTPSQSITVEVFVFDPGERFNVTAEDNVTEIVLSDYLADELDAVLKGIDYTPEVKTLQLYATHVDGVTPADVTWSIKETGGDSGLIQSEIDTMISSDGVFKAYGNMVGCTYTITATYNKEVPILMDTIEIDVNYEYGYVTIDDVDFYVLAKETVKEYSESGDNIGDKEAYLIWSKVNLFNAPLYSLIWSSSVMRTTTLPVWLSGTTDLKSMAIRTRQMTDGYYPDNSGVASGAVAASYTYDESFLLSHQEFLQYVELGNARAVAAYFYSLRTANASIYTGVIQPGGGSFQNAMPNEPYGVRPALWITP